MSWPEARAVEIAVERELHREQSGFLRRVSRVLSSRVPASSEPFVYDEVERSAVDAVVIAPYFREIGDGGSPVDWVLLRSSVRPPILLRDPKRFTGLLRPEPVMLWELPAGLVDAEEETDFGLRVAASRELLEETGFRVAPEKLIGLGPACYPCPGVIAEKQYFFAACVDPEAMELPGLDGSALEALGDVVAVPLHAMLDGLAQQANVDAKTELGLRRLAEYLR